MSRTTAGLALLFVLALGVRVAAIVVFAAPADRPQTYEHGEIARNLVAGRGFTVQFLGVEGSTSQQAPFVPALLAGSYILAGVDTPPAILLVKLLQALAGAALALSVCWLTWSLVPRNRLVGWIAGYGAALYPPHIYMATHVQAAPWAALVLTSLVAWVVARSANKTLARPLIAGGLGGLLLLIEPILALALPFCALALGLRITDRIGVRALFTFPALRTMTLMTVTTVAIVSPWLVRNYVVHHECVFIKSTFGYAFWQGNHPLSWGTDKIPKPSVETIRTAHDGSWRGRGEALWQARHETLYIDDVLLKPQGYDRFQGLTEPQRSRLLGAEARAFIAADPSRYVRLCAQRLHYFLGCDATNPKAADPVYQFSTALWLGLSLAGLVVGRSHLAAWWPTWAIFLSVGLFHALTIVSARFRIPVEPLTFVWAATAVRPVIEPALHFTADVWRRLQPSAPCGVPSTSGT